MTMTLHSIAFADKSLRTRRLLLPALISLTALAAACSDGSRKASDAGTSAAQPARQDPDLVKVQPEMANRFRVSPVDYAEVTAVQDVAGRIEANEQMVTRIGASVTGRVNELLAEVGDRVQRGQALANVASPELTSAQLAYMRANASAELAERSVDRARQLLEADVIGFAELQRRQSELSIARAELRATADQLQLLGIPADAIDRLRRQGTLHPSARVESSLSGTVVERNVSRGQVVQPGDPLFTIADLSSVWVVGALPEQAARTVQPGQAVEVLVPALGDKRLSGRIVFVGDTVQPETRTVSIRTEVRNPARDLKPQMLATMRIAAMPVRALVVPETAVVRENDRDHVFVEVAPQQFRLTPVELSNAVRGMRPVEKGLKPGQGIVVDGAFHLNNERKRAELQ